ncbi:protein APCDD1-like [Dendroctonus ponderosae]|uniref:protein APCDD1-like n=1 Tax=Dendroctonus ponderosae TaxID=77166 RepID=UPI0020350835|nr:protein APCDD1-like [Dendroctonus ponderosae]
MLSGLILICTCYIMHIVILLYAGRPWKSWRKYEEHTVYDSRFDENKKTFKPLLSINSRYSLNSKGSNVHSSDISCLGSLKWAFNELKLLKIELRPFIDNRKKVHREVKMELHLGAIHSNARLRQYYTPSSFQVPLVKLLKEPAQVFVNRRTYNVKTTQVVPQMIFSHRTSPPQLLEKPHLPPYIWGDWVSSRCETRPGGNLHLTRKFSFNSDDSSWIGEHHFHSDPLCKVAKFTATASGNFNLQTVNKDHRGFSEIDFQIERTMLTVFEQQMMDFIDGTAHCGVGEWKINVSKELSLTGGCNQLGIVLPSVQLDVVKVEMDYSGSCLMFLGQVETDFSMDSNGNSERPTAFQLPLSRCGGGSTYSPELWDILNDQMYAYNVGQATNLIVKWYFWVSSGVLFIHFKFVL